jgi:hypothetical protein
VNRKITPPIPEAIVQLQRQLDQFRRTHPRRTKLPEPLWQAAVDLARQHGIYPVAHPLRLDYADAVTKNIVESAARNAAGQGQTIAEPANPAIQKSRKDETRM